LTVFQEELGWNTDPDVYNQVTNHIPKDKTLIRSQAPHYPGSDVIQHLNSLDIKFLTDRKINCIISLNEKPYDDASKTLLTQNKINLVHRPVKDFQAPTTDDFKAIVKAVKDHKISLIHCGYGHGRTGTGVTGIQLYYTDGVNPTQAEVKAGVNHMERQGQKDAVEALRTLIKNG
jgi:protein tyrosine phosphatase